MRRIACFFLALFALSAFFWKPLVGTAAKLFVLFSAHAELSFSDLSWAQGALRFDDVCLTANDTQRLQTSSLSIRCEQLWPLRYAIDLERPHFKVSREIVRQFLQTPKDHGRGSVAFTEGVLEWSDGALPASACSLSRPLALHLRWEGRGLSLEKSADRVRVAWDPLPLNWLLAFVGLATDELDLIQSPSGLAHGVAEFVEGKLRHVEVEGAALSFALGKILYQGDAVLNADLSPESGPERFRVSLNNATLTGASTTVRDLSGLATFQAGVGVKWECSANVESGMRFESTGKGVFDTPADWAWIEGSSRFGSASAHFSQTREGDRTLKWENIGPAEWNGLRDFVGSDWELTSGILSGQLSGPWLQHIDAFAGRHLALKQYKTAFGSENIAYENGRWTITEGWADLEGIRVSQCRGSWDVEKGIAEFTSTGEIPWNCQAVLSPKQTLLTGDVDGIQFTAHTNGRSLEFTRIEGEVKPWFPQVGIPLTSGSLQGALSLTVAWDGRLTLLDYALSLQLRQAATVSHRIARLQQLDLDLQMDSDGWEIHSAKGNIALALSDRIESLPFTAPWIRFAGETGAFDVRLESALAHTARLVGTKQGRHLEIDSARSHIYGAPLKAHDVECDGLHLTRGTIQCTIQRGTQSVEFEGRIEDAMSRYALSVRGLSQPLDVELTSTAGQWNLSSLRYGPLRASCELEMSPERLKLHQGHGSYGDGVAFDFEGSVAGLTKADVRLVAVTANLASVSEHAIGQLAGSGCVTLNARGVEADLDLRASNASFKGAAFENAGSLHLHMSPEMDVLVTGLDCRLFKEGSQGHIKAELFEILGHGARWRMDRAQFFHDAGIALTATLSGSFDGSLLSGVVHEGTFRSDTRFADVHFTLDPERVFVQGKVAHKALETKLTAEGWLKPQLRGVLSFQEGESLPLLIDWSYAEAQGLSVHSIEGSCGGIDAAFHELKKGHLIGSARFDGLRAAEWLPQDIAKFFRSLKIGKGFELKGNLSMTSGDWKSVEFQGIFSGKQIELFGYQFRTLLAQVFLSRSLVHLYDLQISDSAGRMNIPDMRLEGKAQNPEPGFTSSLSSPDAIFRPPTDCGFSRLTDGVIRSNPQSVGDQNIASSGDKQLVNPGWTLHIPTVSIQDFRPSFLHSPDQEPGSMTPLVVRQLHFRNWKGLLDEPKTYTANGDVVFINSYKREETLFDLPSNVFGRILGLDLELLIPVSGEFSFALKDGYFQLSGLKNSYSEAKRSEFFLMEPAGALPRMDLDGNLQILVQMKQFVLFKFTEAFAISIEGTIKDPQFRLTKKKSWLSFGSD